MAELRLFDIGPANAIASIAGTDIMALTVSVTAMARNTSVIAFVFSSPFIPFTTNTVSSIAVNGARLNLIGTKTNSEGNHKLSVYFGLNMDTSAGSCVVRFATTSTACLFIRGCHGNIVGKNMVSDVLWDRGNITKSTAKRNKHMLTTNDSTRKYEITALLCKNSVASNASAGNGSSVINGVVAFTDLEYYVASSDPGIINGMPEGDWRNVSSSSWVSFSCTINGELPEQGGSEDYFQEREKMMERNNEEEERAAPVAAPLQAPIAAPPPPPNPTGFESQQQVMDFIRQNSR